MRQIIFDTETTGLEKEGNDPSVGHRIIEIGCVELIDRLPTGNYFHCYIRPDREVDPEAVKVHGITDQFLQDKPTFNEILPQFLAYLEGADELIAHNIQFDQAFINREFSLANVSFLLEDKFALVDSLALARQKFPGQKNNLDILCKRFNIDNSGRDLHGALLDSELLAEVYLKLTTEQAGLNFSSSTEEEKETRPSWDDNAPIFVPQLNGQWLAAIISEEEKEAHQKIISQWQQS